MKRKLLTILLFTLIVKISSSQSVGIGTSTPSATALLDLNSTSKGFLLPRLDSNQRNLISSPAAGLTIYNTSKNVIEVFNGSIWNSTNALQVINKVLISVGPVGNVEYWIMDYDGTNPVQVSIPALPAGLKTYNGTPPSLSPDGKKLFFFVIKISDVNYGAFYSCNTDGTNLTKVFERNISYNDFQFGGAH